MEKKKVLAAAKKDTEEEIGKLKAEVEDWKQSYLRKQADFQNFTKRKEKRSRRIKKICFRKNNYKITRWIRQLRKSYISIRSNKGF